MDESELLGVNADEVSAVLEHFSRDTFRGREYRYLDAARRGIERGTVLIEDTAVRGFPSIPRTLVLETGIPAFFDGQVSISEKLNGYNVRIADVGEPLAFTRSGLICPYSTQLARERLDLDAFFEEFPERMLCAEFVGPENPYTAHEYPEIDDIGLRVFDIRNQERGTPMPVDRRREVADSFGFPQPELFGTHEPSEAVEAVRTAIHHLDDREREGVVMRSMDGRDALKYTTHSQHRRDLAFAFSLPFDYGRDFVFSRLIREAFQAVEFEEEGDALRERAHDLGEAILEPMVETIRDVQAGDKVGERHTVRASPASVDALLDHLEEQGVTVDITVERTVDGDRVVEFVKVADSTRDSIEYYLGGGTIDE